MDARLAEAVTDLARGLGGCEGLKHVTRGMDELCARLALERIIPRDDLERLAASLDALSFTICTIDRVVSGRIRALSGGKMDAG